MNRGGSGGAAGGQQSWKVGLVNHAGKYLTAESFGFKINAASASFRKKQMWNVEQDANEEDTVYIKSHLGRYLSGDKKGNAGCSSESRGDAEKFVIQYHPDGSGRWAICNRSTGYYFGGTDDMIQCYEKQPGTSEWWTVHLAIHPQVNLRNPGRKKYAHLSNVGDALHVSEVIPWGRDALVELEFNEGKYCIKACDGRYLQSDGRLTDSPSQNAFYTIEMKTVGSVSGVAFRDSSLKYLTAIGKDGVMQARNKSIGKDELFTVEASQPQVFFTAHNKKVASIKQGIDVTANQDGELGDKETFQLEFDRRGEQFRVRTCEDNYWSLEDASGIQAVGNAQSPNGLFSIDWQPDGIIGLKASNGRYVTARMNGSLYAVSDSLGDKEKFTLTIVNRPLLVLRCEFGFVGFKSPSNPRYECNKNAYDVILVEPSGGQKPGAYYLKGHNGKYWSVDGDGNLNADQRGPQPFFFELRGHSKLAIKCPNGAYIRGEQNGIMSAKSDLSKATMWEY